VERELANIMDAIKHGFLTPTTKAELQKAEAERDRLETEIKAHTSNSDRMIRKPLRFSPNLQPHWRERLSCCTELKSLM
jgi:hypothetical protein